MPYYIGTSGGNNLYNFNSIEINETYYTMPSNDTWIAWRKDAGKYFLYSVKVNKNVVTSSNKDKIQKYWNEFWDGCKLLKNKLGCILFQFNSKFMNTKNNIDKLLYIINLVPKNVTAVVEFKNNSWYNIDIINFLEKNGWIVAVVDHKTKLYKYVPRNKIIYVKYYSIVGNKKYVFDKLLTFIKKNKIKKVFVYFNIKYNDKKIQYAIDDAIHLVNLTENKKIKKIDILYH